MSTRRTILWWLVPVGLGASLAGAWLAGALRQPSAPALTAGTWLPEARQLAPFEMRDTRGAAFTRDSFKGYPSLVFFGFTHCPDVCPATLALLADVQRRVAIPDLKLVLVSIDPERDTPDALERYLAAFNSSAIGLRGDPRQIQALTRQFGVAAARVDLPGGGYTMDHSSTVFLMDARGQNVAVFTPPFDRDKLAADLRTVAQRLRS
jgi:protein SCO1/2